MSGWLSPSELAGAPGMPATIRSVQRQAKSKGWESRERRAIGGGREYAISSLPTETRRHFALKAAQSVATTPAQAALRNLAREAEANRVAREDAEAQWQALPEGHRKDRARAREWLLRAAITYAREYGTKSAGFVAFAEAYKAGDIPVPAKHLDYLPHYDAANGVSRGTLYRWEKAWREQGLFGLTSGYGSRAGTGLVDRQPELRNLILAAMVKHAHISPRRVHEFVSIQLPHLRIPSERRIADWMANWKDVNAQLWSYVTNPDKWKSVYMPAAGSAFENITELNQLWEMDGTPGDWMLKDGRHTVITVIDLYSRRAKFLVTKTSKAMAVCTLFRRAVIEWGVPSAVRVDNGKEYVSKQFEGALRSLEIHMQLCVPFASEEKGTVERVQQTMTHGLLDLLPGFIGHSVADRKEIESRKSFAKRVMTPGETVEVELTAAQLQEKIDLWAEHVYAKDAHSGLNGQTPWEVANSWADYVPRISNERALDCLLAEVAGERTVTKKGIRLDNYLYDHADLVRGELVHIKRDPDDIGRITVYGGEPRRYICEAICPEVLGITRAELATHIKRKAKQRMAEQAKDLRALKKHVKENIADVILQDRIEQSQKVTALPRQHRDVEYTTNDLEAAAKAAQAGEAPEVQLDAVKTAEIEAFQKDFKPARASVSTLQADNPYRLYVRYERNRLHIENGGHLPVEEQRWQQRYPQSDDYRSNQSFFADFPHVLTDLLEAEQKKGPLQRASN